MDELHAMTTTRPLTGEIFLHLLYQGTIAAWSRTNRIFIFVDLWKIRTQSKTTAYDMHDTGCKRIGTQKHRSSIEWIHIRGCRYQIWSALLYPRADSMTT